ncbi:Conserved_hypothetical protein [Hexamita inflata]|uniref:Uncharacterized protein n=1 Tax=Hexamita inflata TaxID=28002 RepID=A0AA86TU40_9EUKA|nr:Conserved hypothetical protein [Hexamita inflata]CAI9942886.1 Conserved hypothetical protein [Hexamita inflata]
MISIVLLNKQLSSNFINICNSQLIRASQYINYCTKDLTSTSKLNGSVNFYDYTDSRIFLNVDKIQNTAMSLQINVPQLSSFAIFGFTAKTEIIECEFKVEIEEDLIQAALICIQCDIIISHSTAQFIANGLSVSGLIMKASDVITIESCKIQFRTQAQLSAAVVLLVSQQVSSFSIINVKISSHFQNDLESNAVLVSQVENVQKLDVVLSNVIYCDLKTNFIQAKHESMIAFSQSPTKSCNLCGSNEFMVYGICQNVSLEFSQSVNGVEVCVFPFIYDGHACICASGYFFNVSECIDVVSQIELDHNIVDNFTVLDQRIARNTTILDGRITNNFTGANQRLSDLTASIASNYNNLSGSILSNRSYLENMISNNFAVLNNNIKTNVTLLNNQLAANQNYLEVNLVSNFSLADSNLARNTTELDNRIRANVTSLSNSINTLTVQVNDNLALITSNLASNKQYLETQIINNASKVNAAITSGIAPIRTDLTNVNSTLTALSSQLRTDLNIVNTDLNTRITTITNSANQAHGRIDQININIAQLKAEDANMWSKINDIQNTVPAYWKIIYTATGEYGAMVNTLQLCINGDCRTVQ